MAENLNKKWDYLTWRAAIQELCRNKDERLIVRLDGVVTMNGKRVGSAF